MNTTEPKQALQAAFAELAQGRSRAFVDLMADDFTWVIAGHSPWSRTWRGRQAVREQLLAPLFARFAGTYRNEAQRFIADGDFVVVQCRGDVTTLSGQRYHNSYCFVCEFRDSQLVELTEYMDTQHALEVLGVP